MCASCKRLDFELDTVVLTMCVMFMSFVLMLLLLGEIKVHYSTAIHTIFLRERFKITLAWVIIVNVERHSIVMSTGNTVTVRQSDSPI